MSQNILICPLRFSHKLLFKYADLIVSSRGTINIEAACYGVPNLITTGAYYDGFGFSKRVRTKLEFEKKLNTLLSKKNNNSKYIRDKISYIGKKILKNTQKEINFFLENAI